MKNLLLFLSLISFPLLGQNDFWTVLQAPPGGNPGTFTRFETNGWLFQDYGNKIYRSVDEGQSWQKIYDQLTDPIGLANIRAFKTGVFYAYSITPTGPYDLYKSMDGGNTWDFVVGQTPYIIGAVSSSGRLYAAEDYLVTRVMESDDGGITWTVAIDFTPNIDHVNSIHVDQDDNVIVVADENYYVSTDEGQTWNDLGPSFGEINIMVLPSGHYLKTVEDTASNKLLVRGMIDSPGEDTITIDPTHSTGYYSHMLSLNNGHLLIESWGNLYISEDDGATWTFWADASKFDDFLTLQAFPDGKIAAKKNSSLMFSSDNGLSWSYSGAGVNHNRIFNLEFTYAPKTIWAQTITGLFKSTDDGLTWSRVSSNPDPLAETAINPYATTPNGNLYLVEEDNLFFSSDGGSTFDTLSYMGTSIKGVVADTANNVVYLNSDAGLLRSSNEGQSWAMVSDSFHLGRILHHPTGRLYGRMHIDTSSNYPMYQSDDEGLTWEISPFTLPVNSNSSTLQADKLGNFYVASSDFMYMSSDNGISWIQISYPVSPTAAGYLLTVNSIGNIFVFIANSSQEKVFRSNNSGVNWTQLPWLKDPYDGTGLLEDLVVAGPISFDKDDFLYSGIWVRHPHIYFAKTTHSTTDGAYLLGNASKSADNDCSTFDPVLPMKDLLIKAIGDETWYTHTDTLAGDYEMFIDTGSYMVTAIPHLPFLWDTCNVIADLLIQSDTTYADFSIPSKAECPFITVDLVMPALERCFERDIYIQYCNHGTVAADSVKIFLQLEPFLYLTDTTQNWVAVPDSPDLYCLLLPGMEVSECSTIVTPILVDCDSTELGEVHCITANSWPDSLCYAPPNWSGAEMEASAECGDSTVILKLKNVGTAISQPLDFIVVEDDVVLLQGNDDYDLGEEVAYTYPSTGNYFRIQSDQEPGHPFPGPVAAYEVGCNGSGEGSFQFIEQFPPGDDYGSMDTDCANNIGSYDPNDKQGMPLGFGPDHLVEPGTDIEYLIRFQNTGTAPAHDVVIRDTLSPLFLIGSVRVGAASHPFTWGISGNGILTFRFANINLPDSLNNEPASHGFVSFKISHLPELPLGTVIPNSAGIYFDFNPPVITNTTLHKLGEDFLEIVSSTDGVIPAKTLLSIIPNPANESALVWYTMKEGQTFQLSMYDVYGKLLKRKDYGKHEKMTLNREGLPAGLYLIRLTDLENRVVGLGKLIFQ